MMAKEGHLLQSKTQASEDFFDWLEKCPVHWYRISTNDSFDDHYGFWEEMEDSPLDG